MCVDNDSQPRCALGWSQSRNVGHMYVTNDRLDNPWDTLPSYFALELDELNKTCQ
jgi:hypothetical protein